jgi:hypothetical protein
VSRCLICERWDAAPARTCTDPEHAQASRARAAAVAGMWCSITDGRDAGGWRQYLDGLPIHCGTYLELQEIETRDDDFGSYTFWLPTGSLVRYEVAYEGKRMAKIHASVGGWSFERALAPEMRFRWPRRSS